LLISAELAAALVDRRRLEPLGYRTLRGARGNQARSTVHLGFKGRSVSDRM
jgi:hypothetical protein